MNGSPIIPANEDVIGLELRLQVGVCLSTREGLQDRTLEKSIRETIGVPIKLDIVSVVMSASPPIWTANVSELDDMSRGYRA
ncbi:MAG: hypothetical protein ACE361_11715 [Aureliella sp.]